MQKNESLKSYRRSLKESLDNNFLRRTLDSFACAYRTGRERAFAGMDVDGLIREVAGIKGDAIGRMDELLATFTARAEDAGAVVHLAATAEEANEIIAAIARKNGCSRIVKAKSMTAEETLLNRHLEGVGLEVTETDLGEWIVQHRGEAPSHMVLPAIHLSRHQVADLFDRVTGKAQDPEVEKLVKVARRELRRAFIEADMGITGANFAIAESGTIGLVTNEGNARLVTTLPRVHVVLAGLDKLLPTMEDGLKILRILPRNATGQVMTSYVSWITGPVECAAAPEGTKQLHIVLLDNGRRELARDPEFAAILKCVRCGACANVCPLYRLVGGHKYGHVYIGAIGLILTYCFHGRDMAKNLVQNCLNCGACRTVCAAGIDLPGLIKEVHARIQDEEGHSLKGMLLGRVMSSRRLFHGLLKSAAAFQRPVTGGTPYLRHLPMIFAREHGYRALPALAKRPFRDQWPEIERAVFRPQLRVALFAGCLQDFVYPEQLAAGVRVLAAHGVALEFPMEQSCCGLPALMMGEKQAARDIAGHNGRAMEPDRFDYIVTLCASCASHIKGYPALAGGAEGLEPGIRSLAEKVIDFSSLLVDVVGVDGTMFTPSGVETAYHAPCHLCRGMGVSKPPRELIGIAGHYCASEEEEVCCGFGGTFALKFPELSRELLVRKLENIGKSGAERLVTDCPGCIMQLRGGLKRCSKEIEVKHLAEVVAEAMVLEQSEKRRER
jgi:iron-sulfur cluster protein